MDNKAVKNYFLLAILVAVSVLTFFILRPFINVLVLSVVFAVVFRPLYEKISKLLSGKSPNISALITAFLIVAIIFIPVLIIGAQILKESVQLYSYLANGDGLNSTITYFKNITDYFGGYFPAIDQISFDVDVYLKQGLNLLIQNLGSVFSNIAKLFMDGFVFLFSLFYLLKDGKKLSLAIILISPLADSDDRAILIKLERSVSSVIKGNLIVAVVQGVLCAIGFMIFGVPNPILWGVTASVAALIPGVGTSLVIVPVILFLFFTSSLAMTLGLFIWGTLAVGLIDNYLGPKLVGKNTNLHPLLVMLSVIGGLIFFGPLGFILGPLTVSLLFALIDIFLFVSGSPEKASVAD